MIIIRGYELDVKLLLALLVVFFFWFFLAGFAFRVGWEAGGLL
jgi:hypothetical protein